MIINKEIKNYLLNYKLLIDFQIILNMREISFFFNNKHRNTIYFYFKNDQIVKYNMFSIPIFIFQ